MSWPTSRKDFLKRARAAGLDVTRAKGGHTKVRLGESGPTVTMSTTPSDGARGLMRACLDIRKILGVDLKQ